MSFTTSQAIKMLNNEIKKYKKSRGGVLSGGCPMGCGCFPWGVDEACGSGLGGILSGGAYKSKGIRKCAKTKKVVGTKGKFKGVSLARCAEWEKLPRKRKPAKRQAVKRKPAKRKTAKRACNEWMEVPVHSTRYKVPKVKRCKQWKTGGVCGGARGSFAQFVKMQTGTAFPRLSLAERDRVRQMYHSQ